MDSTESTVLFDTLKMHGGSKLFLKAICLALLGAVLTFALNIYNSVGAISFITADAAAGISAGEIALNIITYCISFVFQCIIFYGLYTAYRYYKGNGKKRNGLDIAVASIGISYIYECIRMGIKYFGMNNDSNRFILSIIILIAAAVLYFLFFRGIRISVEYPKNAESGSPRGRISGFIIAALLTFVFIYFALLIYELFIGFRAIYSPAEEGLEAERALKISQSVSDILQLFVMAPTMAAYMFYLKLIRLFRRDMNFAKELWAANERRNKRSGVDS